MLVEYVDMVISFVRPPVVEFLIIVLNPFSERIGPEKVELAIFISLSWQMSKLILRQGNYSIYEKGRFVTALSQFI